MSAVFVHCLALLPARRLTGAARIAGCMIAAAGIGRLWGATRETPMSPAPRSMTAAFTMGLGVPTTSAPVTLLLQALGKR